MIIWFGGTKLEIITKNLPFSRKKAVTAPLIYGKMNLSNYVEKGGDGMPQDKLELSLRDSLAISAALRLSLSDLFSRIRGIAAHEAMLTPYMRQELEGVLQDGYRLLRLADILQGSRRPRKDQTV